MELNYILRVIVYIVLVLSLYLAHKGLASKGKRLSWFVIIIFTLLFSWYSVFASAKVLHNDKANYYTHFITQHDYSHESIGLNFIFTELYDITTEEWALPFTIGLLCFFLMLSSLRYFRLNSPLLTLFIFSSIMALFPFYGYKQAIANSFIMLLFTAYYSDLKIVPKIILIALYGILAFIFHRMSIIVILLLPIMGFWDNKTIRTIGLFVLFVATIVFATYSSEIVSLLGDSNETLEAETTAYQTGKGGGIGWETSIKGIYFYIITYVAIKRRNLMEKYIPEFHQLLLFSILSSIFLIYTILNYWFFRFSLFLMLPVFYMAVSMFLVMKRNKLNTTWFYLALLSCFGLSIKYVTQVQFRYGGF